MDTSIFDIFKIGIGPSSSHTMGPMIAARHFRQLLEAASLAASTVRIAVQLYGSLASTGRGHYTDRAIILGLEGNQPETVAVDSITATLDRVAQTRQIDWGRRGYLAFDPDRDLEFLAGQLLPHHVNGLRFVAHNQDGPCFERVFYSVGGGFVIDEDLRPIGGPPDIIKVPPFRFDSASQLLELCRKQKLSIADLVLENELTWRSKAEIDRRLADIRRAMRQSIEHGLRASGMLPGPLNVRHRAPDIYRSLLGEDPELPIDSMSWISLYAIAVNEQNAAGGRIVTAPTNGAAGIIPAVIRYYAEFASHRNGRDRIPLFLLTAGAIGTLYKKNASLSAAEMGCQGEIGVACSMAAAGLAAAMGGTNEQIENAAEIGMEHNLGLTCDPIGGLVQIPCIERNAIGAGKAINSALLALRGDGRHTVSLDSVIATMRQTGRDMSSKYKETSEGGLAVNVVEC